MTGLRGYRDKAKLTAERKRYYDKTALYQPRLWTEEELLLLNKRDMTDHELSKLICRSVKAIQIRRCKLNSELREAVNRETM